MNEYMNQSLTWKHVASLSEYNEPTYTTTTIKGRKEGISKLVNNSRGQTSLAISVVYTKTAVSVNDLIDDYQVMRVDAMPWIDGTTNHYEVYLGEGFGAR